MDTCHLRLATPKHAHVLVNHFRFNPTFHSAGLDDIGRPSESEPDGKSPPVVVELVTGKREQLYWEKVPEKIRRQAVQKALGSARGSVALSVESGNVNGSDGATDVGKRKRRRR
ncbi:hypothetical protein C0993_011466 [Termitomyces sp. T159_Od127]|nr:hypothetical protein C0993_011466 [Termitomyces sp. T159_Od127]